MTACCDLCQHPACWKAEIDIRRSALLNHYGYFNGYEYKKKGPLRYDARSECIVETDGSLPTYKTLDLLASGFPPSGDKSFLYDENVPEFHLSHLPIDGTNQLSSSEGRDAQNSSFSAPVNNSLTSYLEKLCDRRLEVQRQDEHDAKKDLPTDKIFFKTLTIEDEEGLGDQHSKVYTWIPGKKPKVKSADDASRGAKETKVLALKMIDGADLPDCSLSDENKHRHRQQSQQGCLYRRKTVPYNLGGEDCDEYFQFLKYLDLSRFKENKLPCNNQDVRIPSPLQTARVKLYNASEEYKSPRHIPKPRHRTTRSTEELKPKERNLDDSISKRSKTMYIKNGVVLPKSPTLKMSENSKPRQRTPLPLTRVSVPKKVVQKLPLFDHCSSSIKKTDLPEVTMQPISSSENTSVASLEKFSGDIDLVHHDGFSSPNLTRVPPCSPLSAIHELILSPSSHPPVRRHSSENDAQLNGRIGSPESIEEEMPGLEKIEPSLERSEMKDSDSSDKVFLNFEGGDRLCVGNAKVAPSTIMISKASIIDAPPGNKDLDPLGRQSPSTSLGSKGSLDGWLLDKDIISRTYDKYQSFTPFKSPQCSAHFLRDDISERSRRNNDSRMLSSRRQILPPSLHNLDQFLPGDDSLKPNNSFTTRCLSPSRSMFIRQQKQPPIGMVPSEITISRYPLLPAITKSQRSMRGDSSCNVHGNEQPPPYTPPLTEDVNSCNGDEDEEVVEVLLNKEAFSATDLFQVNVNSTMDKAVVTLDNDTLNVNCVHVDKSIVGEANGDQADSLNANAADVINDEDSEVFTAEDNSVVCNDEDNVIIQPKDSEYPLHLDEEELNVDELSPQYENGYTSFPPPISNNSTNDFPCYDSLQIEDIQPINESDKKLIASDGICSQEDNNLVIANGYTSEDPISPVDKSFDLMGEKDISERSVELNLADDYTVVNHEGSVIDPNLHTEHTGMQSDIDLNKPLTPASVDDKISNDSRVEEVIESIEVDFQADISDVRDESDVANISKQSNNTPPKLYNFFHGDINSDSVVIDCGGTTSSHGVVADIIIENNVATEIYDDGHDAEKQKDDFVINDTKADEVSDSDSLLGQTDAPLDSDPSDMVTTGSRIFKATSHLVDDPVQSVMKDIFNNQIVQKSSLYITPKHADDFTEGLDLDLQLEEEIVRAMHGLEEFVVDNYEDDVGSNKS